MMHGWIDHSHRLSRAKLECQSPLVTSGLMTVTRGDPGTLGRGAASAVSSPQVPGASLPPPTICDHVSRHCHVSPGGRTPVGNTPVQGRQQTVGAAVGGRVARGHRVTG